MLLRLAPLFVALAACGPGVTVDAGPDAGDAASTPDTSASADANPYACNGPCASGCCIEGSCIDLQNDRGSCGTCGRSCRTDQVCRRGVCDAP